MVRLRLRHTGSPKKPSFRIVATDGRSPRDGKFIEVLGYYDPRHQDEKVDLDRVDFWLKNGAQPSETVTDIVTRARTGKGFKPNPKPKRPVVNPSPVKVEKAEKPAAVAAPAPEAAPAAAPEAPATNA